MNPFNTLRALGNPLTWGLRLTRLEQQMRKTMEDIQGLQAAVAAEKASTADLRAKLEKAVADLTALQGQVPADNTDAIAAIIADLNADSTANTAEPGETVSTAAPAPAAA